AAAEQGKLPAEALAVAQQLSLWFPDDARLYWLVGELYNAQGNVEAALKIFEECLWSRRFDTPELRRHRLVLQEAKPKNENEGFEPVARDVVPAGPKDNSVETQRERWLPETWKIVTVTGAAGALVLLFAYLQMREIRRKRNLRQERA